MADIRPLAKKPDFPTFIDSTGRKDLVLCGQKFNLAQVRSLKPKSFNIHLHFGGCIARGIELYRLAYYGNGKTQQESFAAGAEGLIKMWGDVEAPDVGSGNKKTLRNCLLALEDFFIKFPPDVDPIQPLIVDGKPAVEFTFALPIPNVYHPVTGEPILYTGRFDMIADYNGAIFVNDEKTASYLGDSWINSWDLNSQITGYAWALKKYGYPVQGAIIRGIGILTSETKFLLSFQRRSNWAIERWLGQLQKDVWRAIDQWRSDDWDYALDDACNTYNGCTYRDACLAKNPDKILKLDFEYNPWDPLKKEIL